MPGSGGPTEAGHLGFTFMQNWLVCLFIYVQHSDNKIFLFLRVYSAQSFQSSRGGLGCQLLQKVGLLINTLYTDIPGQLRQMVSAAKMD